MHRVHAPAPADARRRVQPLLRRPTGATGGLLRPLSMLHVSHQPGMPARLSAHPLRCPLPPSECRSASLTSVMDDVHWQIWTRVGGGHGAEASFPFGSGLVGYTLTSAATIHRRDAKVRLTLSYIWYWEITCVAQLLGSPECLPLALHALRISLLSCICVSMCAFHSGRLTCSSWRTSTHYRSTPTYQDNPIRPR